jgi:hypothetical protein
MKKIVVYLITFCLLNFTSAQYTNYDSVKRILALANDDSTKLRKISDLVWIYLYSDPDSALKYIQQEILLAKKIKSDKELSIALIQYEALSDLTGNYPQAIRLGLQGLQVAENPKIL